MFQVAPVAFVLLMALPLVAGADESGHRVILGAGVGVANTDFDRQFDANDTALSAYMGYELTRYIGFELGYVDGGTAVESGVAVDVAYTALMAVASLPLWRRWAISARAGVATGAWESSGLERHDTNVAFGVGTAVDFSRVRLRFIGDTTQIEDARVVHLSLQAAWRF